MEDVSPKPVKETGEPKSNLPTNETEPRRPGRPKGTTTAAKGSKDVESALAVLETAYTLIATGLMAVGAPNSASELVSKIATVQDQNRGFLNADPKLAAQISKIGQSTGRGGFLIVNAMALVPVITGASSEIMAKRRARNVEPMEENVSE
jgi:hypothetical protein